MSPDLGTHPGHTRGLDLKPVGRSLVKSPLSTRDLADKRVWTEIGADMDGQSDQFCDSSKKKVCSKMDERCLYTVCR